jgi:hypothetical protein
VRRLTGDYLGAAGDLEQALAIYRDIGGRGGDVTILNETGTLRRLIGEPAEGAACHQQALELARAIGSAWDEAHVLASLGRCATAVGCTTRATALLRQAYVIFQRIGAAENPRRTCRTQRPYQPRTRSEPQRCCMCTSSAESGSGYLYNCRNAGDRG